MARSGNHLLVVAIDFGTAYSGYAFSMKHEYDQDPTKVSSITWNSSSRALQSLKTPTCILFDSNKQFHSFGFEAEDKYADLAFDDEHKEWYFFKQFKMKLFDKMTVQKTFRIEDELGKSMPAIDVFKASIGFLKNHFLKKCRNRFPDISESDILWVLTVPAIWNEAAKKFMREAATEVGIADDKLILTLEPEAASLYCRSLKVDKFVDSSGGLSPFKPGSKYLVFDAGGGTVDITVHEVKADSTLSELYRASGGNWGGTYVDAAFLQLLSEIVGQDIMKQCKEKNMIDMLDLLREFEVKKRTFDPEMVSKIMFKVPVALNDAFKTKNGTDIKDILSSTKYASVVSWTGDKLRVSESVAKGFFSDVIEGIVAHLRKLFQEEILRGVSVILMVGGFSESQMLQTALRKCFPLKRIIIPEEAGLAVLKGAVIYGHDPSSISERRCRYTYGFSVNKLLTDMGSIKGSSIHSSKKYMNDKGEMRVKTVFDIHATIGQKVTTGQPQTTRSYNFPDGCAVSLDLYASTESNPLYVTDKSCTLLGSLPVDVKYADSKGFTVCITFSDTEILVDAKLDSTGQTINAKFELIG